MPLLILSFLIKTLFIAWKIPIFSNAKYVLTTRVTLVCFAGGLWSISDSENAFDIAMSLYDPAQVTDLVGIYVFINSGFLSRSNRECIQE